MSALSNVKTSEPVVMPMATWAAPAINGDRALTPAELSVFKTSIMPAMEAIKQVRMQIRTLVATLKTQLAYKIPSGEGIHPLIYAAVVTNHLQTKAVFEGILTTLSTPEKMPPISSSEAGKNAVLATRCTSLCDANFSITPPTFAQVNAIIAEIRQCEAIIDKNHLGLLKNQSMLVSFQQLK